MQIRRGFPSLFLSVGILAIGLVVLPACKEKSKQATPAANDQKAAPAPEVDLSKPDPALCEGMRATMAKQNTDWLGSRPELTAAQREQIAPIHKEIEDAFVDHCKKDGWTAKFTTCLVNAKTEGESTACGDTPNSEIVTTKIMGMVKRIQDIAPPPAAIDSHGKTQAPAPSKAGAPTAAPAAAPK